VRNRADLISKDVISAKGVALIDTLLIAGVLAAVPAGGPCRPNLAAGNWLCRLCRGPDD
jgi:hypothetical protein